jgi:hypothetical protein
MCAIVQARGLSCLAACTGCLVTGTYLWHVTSRQCAYSGLYFCIAIIDTESRQTLNSVDLLNFLCYTGT